MYKRQDADRVEHSDGGRSNDGDDHRNLWLADGIHYRRADGECGADLCGRGWQLHTQHCAWRNNWKYSVDHRDAVEWVYRDSKPDLLDYSGGGQRHANMHFDANFGDDHWNRSAEFDTDNKYDGGNERPERVEEASVAFGRYRIGSAANWASSAEA